jgi:hypothetical protein
MTSRNRDAAVVAMHVRSANVLRENTESRRSLDSSEKNRLNSENTTTPMVLAMASVCSCSAQLTTLSVPTAITSPTVTSQARTPPLRIGWLGGRGRRSISPSTGLLYPSPMDWIVTVVKATHKTCSGRSGSPRAMSKMLAPRKVMMKPNMHPISNRMYRTRLSYSPRPISTALVIVEKLSSVRIITAACLATSVPVWPIAIPMSAFFSAGASLTPSPVMATIRPSRLSMSTRRTLCSGVTRAITPTSAIASVASSSVIAPNSAPLMTLPSMPSWRAIAAAVTA